MCGHVTSINTLIIPVVINGPSRYEGVWCLTQTSRSPGDEILQDSTGINFPLEQPHVVKGILFATCFLPSIKSQLNKEEYTPLSYGVCVRLSSRTWPPRQTQPPGPGAGHPAQESATRARSRLPGPGAGHLGQELATRTRSWPPRPGAGYPDQEPATQAGSRPPGLGAGHPGQERKDKAIFSPGRQ